MTVCVAAIAENSRAIVLVADKALTFGDNIYTPAMQEDTGIRKILPIGKSGWMAMTAGEGGYCDLIVTKLSEKVKDDPDIVKSALTLEKAAEEIYQQVHEDAAIANVLRSNAWEFDICMPLAYKCSQNPG